MVGYEPVAVLFVREVGDPLTSLVKSLDKRLQEAAARRPNQDRLGVFVILLSDDEDRKRRFTEMIGKERLEQVVLCTDRAPGPGKFRFASGGDLPAWSLAPGRVITAKFSIAKGELTQERAEEIVKNVLKSVPTK